MYYEDEGLGDMGFVPLLAPIAALVGTVAGGVLQQKQIKAQKKLTKQQLQAQKLELEAQQAQIAYEQQKAEEKKQLITWGAIGGTAILITGIFVLAGMTKK